MKRIMIMSGVIVFLALTSLRPAYAQSETQQLNQKINALEGRIQQLQTQLSQDRTPVVLSPWFDYGYQWDPFVQMQDMQQQMDRLINRFSVEAGKSVLNLNVIEKTDMQQTPSQYLITINIPGIEKKDISVELRGRTLIISGNRHHEVFQKKGRQSVSKEQSSEYFVQSFLLPDDALLQKINSHYDKGVLTISIAREQGGVKKSNFQKIVVK